MKILKSIVATLLILSCASNLNAQIAKPVNKQLDLNKIKPNRLPDLKLKKSGIRGFVKNSIGKQNIPGVKIIFEHVDGKSKRQTVISGKYGEFNIELRPGQYLTYGLKDGYIPYVTHPGYNVVEVGSFGTLNIYLDAEASLYGKNTTLIAVFNTKNGKLSDVIPLNKKSEQALVKRENVSMFYAKSNAVLDFKAISKGTTITINLEKQYIPGDQFIPGNQFIPGDQFVLNSTKFIVADKTEKELKIITY